MTEEEWLGSGDLRLILLSLREGGEASKRKLRLFAAACCRRIWHLLEKIGKDTVEVTERLAEGEATEEERNRAENLAWWGADSLNYEGEEVWTAGWAAHAAVEDNAYNSAILANVAEGGNGSPNADLVRDIFGNPFRPRPPLQPAWLVWNARTVPRIASTIYEQRKLPEGTFDTSLMGVLADALEDAGCTDTLLLDHLRGPGPHVRGCFALDLLLGKE